MKTIDNNALKASYIKKHHIDSFFCLDIECICDLVLFEKDEYLIRESEISHYLYFLVSGECRYFSIDNSGAIIPLGGVKDYSVLGEVGSFFNYPPRNNVQAVTRCYCLRITIAKYHDLLFNDIKFLQYLCTMLAARVRKSSIAVETLVSLSAEERTAAHLLEINENGKINASLKSISEAISISYRHLLRVISSFVKLGYLKKDNGKYYITNQKALRKIADSSYSYFETKPPYQ